MKFPVWFRNNQKLLFSLLLLALLPLILLWRVVFNGDVLLSADMLLLYEPWHSELPGATATPIWNEKTGDPLRDIYPVAFYIRDTWRQGQIPFWYPYTGLGLPILARAMNQVLYPPNNILWQVMDIAASFGWSAILHLFLAGVFTFFYARELKIGYVGSLVAAIAFSYSSIPMTWLGLPFIFDSMIWLPLIFWGLERAINRKDWRWSLLGVAGLALQILAGSLQLVSYGLTALGIYALGRAVILWRQRQQWKQVAYPLTCVAVITGLGLGLAAFQILSTLELVQAGVARADVDINLQLPLRNLARLLIPDIWGTPLDGHNLSSLEFESYLYLGILPLFFIIASLFSARAAIARLLFGVGLLFLLVIYNVPPFFQIFYYIYPAFDSLGFHRSLYAVVLVWAATAGIGADYLLNQKPERLLKTLTGAGLCIGLVVLIITARLAFIAKYQERFFWQPGQLPDPAPNFLYHFSALVLFLVLLAVMVGILGTFHRLPKPILSGLILVCLTADLFLAHLDFTPALPRHMLNVSPPSLTFLHNLIKNSQEPLRVSGVKNILRSDTGGAYQIPSIQIHDSYLSERLSDYADLTQLRRGGTFRDIIFAASTNPLLNGLNVKYIYANREDLTEGDWVSILQKLEPPQVISTQPGAGQIREWTINNWTQPVFYAPANTTLSYQSVLPYPALLETAIAVDPQVTSPGEMTFAVYVTKPGETPGQPVLSYRLTASETQWRPVTVDLAPFVDQPVTISLVTESVGGHAAPGGWADPMIIDSSKYEPVYYGVNSIYKNKNSLPRAWVAHQIIPARTQVEARQKMSAADFDPARAAVIEGELSQNWPLVNGSSPTPRFIQYSPTYAKIEVNLNTPGLLVLSDLYYPGWQAVVDGVSQPLYATNLTMRGVYAPAGRHQVEFIYDPSPFKWGVYLSGGSLAALLIGLLLHWRLKKKRGV